jgi:hypothetical protein
MSEVIKNYLSQLNLAPVKEVLPEHKDFFRHQLAVISAAYGEEKKWSWVNDRVMSLKRAMDVTEESPH